MKDQDTGEQRPMWKDFEIQWQGTCTWADLIAAAVERFASEGCDPATAVVESTDRDLVSFNAPRYVIRLRALRRGEQAAP